MSLLEFKNNGLSCTYIRYYTLEIIKSIQLHMSNKIQLITRNIWDEKF